MAVEIAEVEFEDAEGTSVVKRREVFWVIRFEIVERKADTIAQDDIARQLAVAALAGEVVEVDEGLGFRFGEGSFGTLVLDQEDSRPKQIENPVGSPCRAYGVLKYGHALARNTEDVENSFQNVCLFCSSCATSDHSREKRMVRSRVSFQRSFGMVKFNTGKIFPAHHFHGSPANVAALGILTLRILEAE